MTNSREANASMPAPEPEPRLAASAGAQKATKGDDALKPGADRDILDTAWTLGRFNTFTTAARSSGVAELLTGVGPFTVFAPTDRAFAKLPARERDALLANPERLAEVLRHHVVEGKVKAPRQNDPRTATPMHGNDLTITAAEGVYHVGEAKLVKTNFRASNGVIHAIDTVLMPS